MVKKIVGIYRITCTKNSKSYVGQSTDIKRRFGISDEAREKLRKLHTGRKRPEISRKVKCIETEEIFSSIKAAAEHYGLNNSNISVVLSGKKKTCGGFHWEYVNGQSPQYRPEKMRRKISKPVRCIETGVIYASISKAAEIFGVTDSAIGNAVNGKHKKSCGYHWEFCTA